MLYSSLNTTLLGFSHELDIEKEYDKTTCLNTTLLGFSLILLKSTYFRELYNIFLSNLLNF